MGGGAGRGGGYLFTWPMSFLATSPIQTQLWLGYIKKLYDKYSIA